MNVPASLRSEGLWTLPGLLTAHTDAPPTAPLDGGKRPPLPTDPSLDRLQVMQSQSPTGRPGPFASILEHPRASEKEDRTLPTGFPPSKRSPSTTGAHPRSGLWKLPELWTRKRTRAHKLLGRRQTAAGAHSSHRPLLRTASENERKVEKRLHSVRRRRPSG